MGVVKNAKAGVKNVNAAESLNIKNLKTTAYKNEVFEFDWGSVAGKVKSV